MSDLVPDGWRIENIETIANVGSSKRILQSEYVPSGVPFFRSKEAIRRSKNLPIENPLYISQKRFKELKDKHGAPKKNEILVTAVGTIGVIYLIEDIEFYFKDGNLLWIKHIDEDVSPSYLAKYLASDTCHNAIIEIAGGSSQSALTIEKLSKLEFNLPPLPEQQKIAAILSSVDEVIEKTQAQINKLKDLKTGMMQELLSPREGQAANIHNPQGESGNSLHHTEFKDSPLGRIPVGWEVVTLGKVTRESAFGPRFSSDYYSVDGNIGCIRTTDMDKNWDIDYTTVPLAELEYTEFESHILQQGDLLVTRSGTCGVVDVYREQLIPMVAAAFLIRFRLTETVNPWFIRYAMMSTDIQDKIQLLASGGVQKNLSGTNLKTLLLPMPNKDEQDRIVKIIDSVGDRVGMADAKLKHLNMIKKALMQDLLTGKVRVKVDAA